MANPSDAAKLPEKMLFRIERTEYVEIEVDTAGLIDEWKDDETTPWDEGDMPAARGAA